jgi:hypothetical protein
LVAANTPRRVHWAWIGALIAVVVVIAGALVVLVAPLFSTVPVIIINDTATDVIIPNCGSDLVRIKPGADVVVAVNRTSRGCGVDAERGGNEVLVGCPEHAESHVSEHAVSRVGNAAGAAWCKLSLTG